MQPNFQNLIQSTSQFEQQLEIRPLGLVVKRITSITHNAMIRSLVRFWQRAAFFFANVESWDRFLRESVDFFVGVKQGKGGLGQLTFVPVILPWQR
jgi:hypothetical protein